MKSFFFLKTLYKRTVGRNAKKYKGNIGALASDGLAYISYFFK